MFPIISLEQAKADWTKSQLKTIIRSIERIHSKGYQNFDGSSEEALTPYRDRRRTTSSLRKLVYGL